MMHSLYEILGPYTANHSLNVPWNSQAANRLIKYFKIDHEHVKKCILTHPGESFTWNANPNYFPSTRPYLKSRPCGVWKWVVETFGPHHVLSVACMDDALSRAVSDPELHAIHHHFLDAGFIFRPRHVRIVACRALHASMSRNAIDLIKRMSKQIQDRKASRHDVGKVFPIQHQLSFEEESAFKQAFSDHVFHSSWMERLQGSGHRAQKFLDECVKIDKTLHFLLSSDYRASYDSHHTKKFKSRLPWTKRIKSWWEKYVVRS